MKKKNMRLLALLLAAVLALSACGGGNKDDSSGGGETTPPTKTGNCQGGRGPLPGYLNEETNHEQNAEQTILSRKDSSSRHLNCLSEKLRRREVSDFKLLAVYPAVFQPGACQPRRILL